ncbi:integrase [Paenochrobactrum gallinarii]|uniref:Integrase n=1 Tax=Paenochrobactrum gallinarii TaxID=643673 RepID=A0A841M486_9HYPH|nr:integrase [Paenochrobactrum gallinarii]
MILLAKSHIIRGNDFRVTLITVLIGDQQVESDTPNRIATAHGFRSTFRDWASENGYPRDVAERALAHTIGNATEAAYHRTDLLDKRRGMMAAWESYAMKSS